MPAQKQTIRTVKETETTIIRTQKQELENSTSVKPHPAMFD